MPLASEFSSYDKWIKLKDVSIPAKKNPNIWAIILHMIIEMT